MTVLAAQHIRALCFDHSPIVDLQAPGLIDFEPQDPLITPFVEREVVRGRSYGLSSAGYDIRVKRFINPDGHEVDRVRMNAGDFILASTVERIKMPNDLICIVHDKSSWAREGLCVQNTVLEPGWEGFITLELSFHRPKHSIVVTSGDPIAQLIFHKLSDVTEQPYKGKYQNQEDRPVEALEEKTNAD